MFIQQYRDELSQGILSILAAHHILEAEAGQTLTPRLLEKGDQARQLAADQKADQETRLACSACQACYVAQPAAKIVENEQSCPSWVNLQTCLGIFISGLHCLLQVVWA